MGHGREPGGNLQRLKRDARQGWAVCRSAAPILHQLDADDEEAPWSDLAYPNEPVTNFWRHVGRNDPCPCGSGKKAKKCCLANGEPPA